jgi:hypothetical protein
LSNKEGPGHLISRADLPLVLVIKIRDGSRSLAFLGLVFEVLALVAVIFAFADADFDLDAVAFPVGAQDWEGEALLLRLGEQLHDFVLMQQQAPGAAGLVGGVAGFVVKLDVTAVEPDLAAVHAGEGVRNIEFPEADGFDLGAAEFDASLVSFEDVVVAGGFAVRGDLGHGSRGEPQDADEKRAVLPVGQGGLVLVRSGDGDLALDDFHEGKVGFTQAGTALDEHGVTRSDLTDSLGDHVDQNGVIFND